MRSKKRLLESKEPEITKRALVSRLEIFPEEKVILAKQGDTSVHEGKLVRYPGDFGIKENNEFYTIEEGDTVGLIRHREPFLENDILYYKFKKT